VRKTRRVDAQGALLSFAQAMERELTANQSYSGADGDPDDEATGANASPAIFPAESPLDGSRTLYNLRINQADSDSYVLLAVPVNAQTGDGVLGLRSTGERGWDRDADGNPFEVGETCWEITCN
jgi:type IV pilus assembly protein PilE